jgi:hypothetical protein
VRVLEASGMGEPVIDDLPNATDPKKYGPIRRLVIPATAVSPDFKVLLYPHRPGTPMPKTVRTSDGVTVEFEGQRDRLTLSPSQCGKTNLGIKRDGANLVSVTRELEPLRDESLEREAVRVEKIRRDLAGFDPNSIPGRVVIAAPADVATAPGKVGTAWKFDGAKEGRTLPVDLKTIGSGGFTVMFWGVSTGGDGSLISCNGNRGFALGFEHGKFLRTDALGQHRWKGNVPLDINRWHHFAVAAGEGTLSMYVDGRLLKSDALTTPVQLAPATVVGTGLRGLLDGLRVYSRGLDADDIGRLHACEAYRLPRGQFQAERQR